MKIWSGAVSMTLMAAVGGCADPVGDAQKRVAIVEDVGSQDDLCAARRDLAKAYLQAKDAQGYKIANLDADLACNRADIDRLTGYDRRYPDIAPDDMSAEADNLEAAAEAALAK